MKKHLIIAAVIAASIFTSSQSYAQCCTFGVFRPFAAVRSFFQPCQPCQPCNKTESSCASGSCALQEEPKEYAPGAEGYCANGSCSFSSALDRVNACRTRYGLRALKFDVSLDDGAQSQVKMNAAYGSLFHGAGNEIIAYNYSDFDAAISSWLASPAHRTHLLNSGYTRAGAAFHRDQYGRVWCAVRFR